EATKAPTEPTTETLVLPPLEESGGGGTLVLEVVRISFESLLANRTRSLLTMLGVIIVVASVVALLSLGQGATASITGAVVGLGAPLALDLFGKRTAVRQSIHVDGQALRVIGVLASKGGSSFGSVDGRAFVPITLAQQQLFAGRTPDGNSYRVSSVTLSAA